MRAEGGETRNLVKLARAKVETVGQVATPVILCCQHGGKTVAYLPRDTKIMCIAGGTGITYVLPILLSLINQASNPHSEARTGLVNPQRSDLQWARDELDVLRRASATGSVDLKVRIFITRESGSAVEFPTGVPSTIASVDLKDSLAAEKKIDVSSYASSSSRDGFPEKTDPGGRSFSIQKTLPKNQPSVRSCPDSRHPDLTALVTSFVDSTICAPTSVYASGPGGMVSDLRHVVARCNSPGRIWNGDQNFDVELVCDDRLEG